MLLMYDTDMELDPILDPQPSVSPVIAGEESASYPPPGERIESMHSVIRSPS